MRSFAGKTKEEIQARISNIQSILDGLEPNERFILVADNEGFGEVAVNPDCPEILICINQPTELDLDTIRFYRLVDIPAAKLAYTPYLTMWGRQLSNLHTVTRFSILSSCIQEMRQFIT